MATMPPEKARLENQNKAAGQLPPKAMPTRSSPHAATSPTRAGP